MADMATDLTFGINEQYKPLIAELCLLPCFAQQSIKKVFVIDAGLSKPCFKVQLDDTEYFAKHVTSGHTEVSANKLATNYGVAPKLIYGEGDWLITEFISGELLANTSLNEDEKLTATLSLLAQCHRLAYPKNNANTETTNIELEFSKLSIPILATEKVIAQLLNQLLAEKLSLSNKQLSPSQHNHLRAISETVQQKLAQTIKEVGQDNEVFCHGDANFSNIIQIKNNTLAHDDSYQLIDFECACIAPIEYDLAMFMAVNEIQRSKISAVIAVYSQEYKEMDQQRKQQNKEFETVDNHQESIINTPFLYYNLVTCYLDLCFLINGLWYLLQYQERELFTYKILANKQFSLLAMGYPETNIVID